MYFVKDVFKKRHVTTKLYRTSLITCILYTCTICHSCNLHFTRVSIFSDDEAKTLYHFITGLSSPSVSQEQLHAEFIMSNPRQKLPEAMTCFETLMIPVGNKDYEEFKESFHHAIKTFDKLAANKPCC